MGCCDKERVEEESERSPSKVGRKRVKENFSQEEYSGHLNINVEHQEWKKRHRFKKKGALLYEKIHNR